MDPTKIIDGWHVPASKIDDNHWQSGAPDPFKQVHASGIEVIVFTASDVQPNPHEISTFKTAYPGLSGILCPFDDTEAKEDMPEIARLAHAAAFKTVIKLNGGKRVLVSCAAGRNRSALVSALVLMRRRNLSGLEAMEWVRERRNAAFGGEDMTLTNRMFAAYLASLPRPE